MRVLVFGATGKIGRLLCPGLIEDGHEVSALVRDAAAAADLLPDEVRLLQGDLERPFEAAAGAGYDAAIFTAGSGASTGKDKTLTVDLWGALQATRYCESHGTRRFILISALKANDPNRGAEALKPYLVAKHAADELLRATRLDYTILRPGRLTDKPPSGRVHAARSLSDYNGDISRANVAACIRTCLGSPGTEGKVIDLLDGDTPIDIALPAAG